MLDIYLSLASTTWGKVVIFAIGAVVVVGMYAIAIRIFCPNWYVRRKINRTEFKSYDDPEYLRLLEKERIERKKGYERTGTAVISLFALYTGAILGGLIAKKTGLMEILYKLFW